MFVSTSGMMALVSTGYRCSGKLDPSRSSTSKKMYESTIITQAMEIARQRTEDLKDRKEASMGLFPFEFGYRKFYFASSSQSALTFDVLSAPLL
jgi:hypothetical protein